MAPQHIHQEGDCKITQLFYLSLWKLATSALLAAFEDPKTTMSMRIQVQLSGECVAVATSPKDSIRTLAESAIAKLAKLKPKLFPDEPSSEGGRQMRSPAQGRKEENLFERVREVRRTLGGALLDPDDKVQDVLRDAEFIIVVLKRELGETTQHPIVGAKILHTPEDSLFHHYKEPSAFIAPSDTLTLDGYKLTTADLVRCGRGLFRIRLADDAADRIRASRSMLEDIVSDNKVVYGITTGFGNFANVCIEKDKLIELQQNLIRSHACGVGPPLPPSRARMVLALRINVLAKGYAGISLPVVNTMIEAFNAFCVSWVPEKGTVGCSGDLAPLAHLALGLMGEGRMWSPQTGWQDASKVLKTHGIKPIELGPKEGIALINGTQLVSALGAEAIERAQAIANQADVIAALTLDVLKGTTTAFDPDIHALRPHAGQVQTAERLRALLHSDKNPSQIAESHRFCGRVQDAYTMRCVPQVHGVVHDTIKFVKSVLEVELNSATDNPLVFPKRGEILSGGNFHGEYPAKMLDYLGIGVHELASMSERRLERLVNGAYSGLPDFLTKEGGLNSGFMMVQVTAASLVLAMELLAACQGMEFLKPLSSTAPLQSVYNLVRSVSPAIERDRFFAPEMEAVIRLLQDGKVWEAVAPHLASMSRSETEHPDYLWTPVASPTSAHLHKDAAGSEPARKTRRKQ